MWLRNVQSPWERATDPYRGVHPDQSRRGAAWGYTTDPSGLLQLGARFYWPELGRFIQHDPIGDDINWYAYAANNPVVFIDPEGLHRWWTWDVVKATAKGAGQGLVCSVTCTFTPVTYIPGESVDWGGLGGSGEYAAKKIAMQLEPPWLNRMSVDKLDLADRYAVWKRAGGGLGPSGAKRMQYFRRNAVTDRLLGQASRLRRLGKLGKVAGGPVTAYWTLYDAIKCANTCS